MWGNLHGWLISAILAVLILLPIAWLAELSGIAQPTGVGADPANLAPLALPYAPKDVWAIFTQDADAGDAYRKVINAWDDTAEQAAESYVQSPSGEPPAVMRLLVDARHDQRMRLFSADLPSLINYQNDHPDLEKLAAAGEWAYKIGLSLNLHGHPDDAKPYVEAAFALGRQLYRERIIYDEYQRGTQLMADASEAMRAMVPKGSELYDQLGDFQRGLADYQDQRVIPIWRVISSVDQDVIAHSAGDVAALARNSQESMWRVEAVLKLGRYRYDAGSLGDQIGAAHLLRQLTTDADPAVAAAAAAARGLTLDDYRMIH